MTAKPINSRIALSNHPVFNKYKLLVVPKGQRHTGHITFLVATKPFTLFTTEMHWFSVLKNLTLEELG